MGELQNLPNIGPSLEQQLEGIGVFTLEQLIAEGSKTAWLKIKARDSSA